MAESNKRIAIIRVRGKKKIKKGIEDTMTMLKLYRKNTCVIVKSTKPYIGMLEKIKDYVTWGEIGEKTFIELLKKRGKLPAKQELSEEYMKEKAKASFEDFAKDFFAFKKELKDIPGLKQFFRLNPPKQGFERKGIKKPYSLGGALGYRKENINNLIKNML